MASRRSSSTSTANELHANEVAILPYYVANLNIEATYAAITGEYEEFPNLCFVDTLDNVGLHTSAHGATRDLFGSVSEENVERIKRQNSRRISVIIGNPPYNANQVNENDNNKNREYPEIDKRIKETYIHASTAQKTKLYDMYARFFRWASDRLAADGVLAFITNRSFIDSRTFDGFRKTVAKEFTEIYVVDLGGDVRANPKLCGTKHNVFGIQTGVAISFMVKRHGAAGKKGARMYYARRPEMETAEEKLAFLGNARASVLEFDEVRPDARGNWINLTSNDFDDLMPVASKVSKASNTAEKSRTIFKLFSLGVVTARDEWVYDESAPDLSRKVDWLINQYNADVKRLSVITDRSQIDRLLGSSIKWSRAVKNDLRRNMPYRFSAEHAMEAEYRPFVRRCLYFDKQLNEVQYKLPTIFTGPANPTIAFLCVDSSNPLAALAVERPFDYCLLKKGNGGTQCLPRWAYDEAGTRLDNITDWSLAQFKKHYKPGSGKKGMPITKEAIFHYVYAVLHDPQYREKYAQNLKREFPRMPLYGDSQATFWLWTGWGERLMALHIGYEAVEPFALKRSDVPDEKARTAGQSPKPALKSDKDIGLITLDSETKLAGVPPEAWRYQLGNRCAIDWVLDQYKEKKPKDPTIRAKFDTYRFADHKEKVIDLLARVTTVSVETMRIVDAMRDAPR